MEEFKYKIGDFAWFVPYGEKRAHQGEIHDMNLEIENKYVVLIVVGDGKYRTTRPEQLADTSKEAKQLWLKICS